MISSTNNRNSNAYMCYSSKAKRVHQGTQTEKIAGYTEKNIEQASEVRAPENDNLSISLSRQEDYLNKLNSYDIDMTHTTRSRMMDWVNNEIKNGNISLDDGFPFMAMAMKIPATETTPFGFHLIDNTEVINIPEIISKGIEGAESRGSQQTLDMLRSAQYIIEGNPNMLSSPVNAESHNFPDSSKTEDVSTSNFSIQDTGQNNSVNRWNNCYYVRT